MTEYQTCNECLRKEIEIETLRNELHNAYKVIGELVRKDNENRKSLKWNTPPYKVDYGPTCIGRNEL